ncbi:MAG: hypothetical protein RLZZ200_3060, partial [Pseudomonadota bacterium]
HLNAVYPWLMRKYRTRFDLQSLFWQLLVGRSYLQQSYLPNYWDKQIRKRRPDERPSPDDRPEVMTAKNAAFNARVDGYKGYMGPPVFVECIDPRIIFPVMTPRGPEAYIKVYQVQRFEMAEAFKKAGKTVTWRDDGSPDVVDSELEKQAGLELPTQTADFSAGTTVYYEYIDDEEVVYATESRELFRIQHNGGIRIFPAYGLQTGFKEVHLMAVGLLWAVRNELPQFDFMRTLWVQKAYLDVFPQLFAQLGKDDQPILSKEGEAVQWDIEPMTVKQIRGQLVNALKDAQSGMDFRAAVDMFANDIDQATLSSLARGIAGAQQPGYSINQLSQAMRTAWKPIIESRQDQFAEMGADYLQKVAHVWREETTVFCEGAPDASTGRRAGEYNSVSPEDIGDFYQVVAHLDPELPIDKQGTMLTAAKLLQESALTWEDYVREGLGKHNPQQYWREVMRDTARRAYLPKAIEDGMALGRVQLTNQILQAQGLDRLNTTFSQDVQALKAARAGQAPPGGAPAPNGTPSQMPMAATPPGPPPANPGGQGDGIQPTVGANPNDPAPGFRGGGG